MAMHDWPKFNNTAVMVKGGCVGIYDRDDYLGKGRCFSIFTSEGEVLRFDLFDDAHFHVNIGNATRNYFDSRLSYPELVDQALLMAELLATNWDIELTEKDEIRRLLLLAELPSERRY